MIHQQRTRRCLFVLDTNVLIHDPTALFRFQEHDIYLPMVVIEELDGLKKGVSEIARNVRQASRFLDGLMTGVNVDDIEAGLPLHGSTHAPSFGGTGRLFFQTRAMECALPQALAGQKADNAILGLTLALMETRQDVQVALVSKDINMRIKAAALGIRAEDYENDQVLEDADLLYTGVAALPDHFWEEHSQDLHAWKEGERSYYRIHGPLTEGWHPNEFLSLHGESPLQAVFRKRDETGAALVETAINYTITKNKVWGISALNLEQSYALNLLMDPEIEFVTLIGQAGTGKTLLTLAAALFQTLDKNIYSEIIMTRVTVPVGDDIGFLPGNEEEKMTPWMGALMDNLDVLTHTDAASAWERQATQDLVRSRIKIRSLNFMRGRTFLNKFLIFDETQNLTSKQVKTLVTRAGHGTKVVCLGNIAQIDTPYLTETTSGLTYVVDRFKDWEHSGHVTLLRGERSRLAEFASENL
jgi:PhoH-like ATPase